MSHTTPVSPVSDVPARLADQVKASLGIAGVSHCLPRPAASRWLANPLAIVLSGLRLSGPCLRVPARRLSTGPGFRHCPARPMGSRRAMTADGFTVSQQSSFRCACDLRRRPPANRLRHRSSRVCPALRRRDASRSFARGSCPARMRSARSPGRGRWCKKFCKLPGGDDLRVNQMLVRLTHCTLLSTAGTDVASDGQRQPDHQLCPMGHLA